MSKNAVALLLVFLLAPCLIAPLPATAAPKTIIVPDDYPTIRAAIGNATAGDTIFVKKGTYEGPIDQTLVIDKSISLIGEDANATIINLHPPYNETWITTQVFYDYYDAISIDANDVTLSNFTITIRRGGDISVNGNRTRIIRNNISIIDIETGLRVKSAFNVIAANSVWSIFLDNANSNMISNNTCGHLRLGYAHKTSAYNVISGNKIEAGTRSLYGILIGSSSHNVFCNNYIANCRSSFGGNGVAIGGEDAENNTFYHNNFVANNKHVGIYYGDLLGTNFWDKGGEGNFWDDYNGTDSNRDGIGDTPYVINGDNIDYYPLIEPFDVEGDVVVLPPPEPFPIILVAAALVIVAVGVGLLVYFRKIKKTHIDYM